MASITTISCNRYVGAGSNRCLTTLKRDQPVTHGALSFRGLQDADLMNSFFSAASSISRVWRSTFLIPTYCPGVSRITDARSTSMTSHNTFECIACHCWQLGQAIAIRAIYYASRPTVSDPHGSAQAHDVCGINFDSILSHGIARGRWQL